MGFATSRFQGGGGRGTRQFAMSLSRLTAISTHSRFASSMEVLSGATFNERIRALLDSTGLKSLICANASICRRDRAEMSEGRMLTEHTRALLAEIAGTVIFVLIRPG